MGIGEIVYQILIGPLELFFEVLYTIANRLIGNYGLSIIVLSLIMNFLVLPIYQRADRMQEEQRDIEAKLHDGIEHIRKTFKGDERMMMLQTYYRQNDYKPTDVIKGSISLFLEIPFFIAAYRFLSHLGCLQGVSFGPIPDLGAPDGMIPFFGDLHLNLLPIIMTVTNVISAAIYTRGFPRKTKIQLYGMAAFFLVFLYASPAGLVFYWTLNNVFSLIKNVFYKLKHPKRVLAVMSAIAGIIFLVVGGMQLQPTLKRNLFLIGVGILLELPILFGLFRKKISIRLPANSLKPNKAVFLSGSLFLTVLIGLMIPSTFVKASPLEFIDVSNYLNPIWYVVSALCLSVGFFLVWLRVFYWLAADKGKCIFDRLVWAAGVVALVDYLLFGRNLGIISSDLVYENGLHFARKDQMLNLLLVIVIIIVVFLLLSKWQNHLKGILFAVVIAVAGLSLYNVNGIRAAISDASDIIANSTEQANWNLSQNGKNVIVIMADRAMGEYTPYIFNEKPELKEQFAGFIYYGNTMSYGGHTNFGSPALYGGYEYTPYEMNLRDEELLVDKQNEALKVMPVLFDQNGYEVTVCDPSYAGYSWVPDLSIYDEYPNIDAYITNGNFTDPATKAEQLKSTKRNFFCFSIMKSMPLFTQSVLYSNGSYNAGEKSKDELVYDTQEITGLYTAEGVTTKFMNTYNVLSSLPDITNIKEDETNTFLMMSNDTTHTPIMLQEPEYEPAMHIDNTEYEKEHADRFMLNGRTLEMDDELQVTSYQCNMAAYIQLGKWFDYMRENGVYDNTRIIIVADHGYETAQLEEFLLDGDPIEDLEYYYPLLMVKDFDSTEFKTSDEFMTNGDVPTIATDELITDPVNPFTGKAITSDAKQADELYVNASHIWDSTENNGKTFLPGRWLSLKNHNIWDINNWEIVQEDSISPLEEIE